METKTYGELRLGEKQVWAAEGKTTEPSWVLDKTEPHVAIRLKQLFPRIPKAGISPYHLPITDLVAADLDWFMIRYPLKMTDEDRKALKQGRFNFENHQAEMERIFLPDYKPSAIAGIREGQKVRDYQAQAVDLTVRRKFLLLGDEVGLGKTYTAAAFFCAASDALPGCVVVDPHLQQQWKDKIEAFTHMRVHMITKTTPYELPTADVYLFRVSQLAGWVNIFEQGFFKAVVYDEPQSLRTGTKTAKGAAAKVLSEHADYRLGLTATPIYNYGSEMWNVLQFIDPYVLGDWDDFAREWCTGFDGNYRIKDPEALGSYLREQHVLLRRLPEDVGMELPKVSKIVEHVEHDKKEVQSVEDLARQLAIKATTGTFVERGSAARDLDIMMRQVTGVAKARSVANFARILVEAGEPVIIWGWHRQVYDIWNKELHDLNPAMYTGSETTKRKEYEKHRFISGQTDLMFMSLRSGAGADGLQHRCCTGIFGELDWSPGIHHQCLGRLDRDGQTRPVTGFFLVTDDGSDPPMMDVLGIKASEAHNIVDPGLGVIPVNTDVSNLRRLVERFLDKRDRKRAREVPDPEAMPKEQLGFAGVL